MNPSATSVLAEDSSAPALERRRPLDLQSDGRGEYEIALDAIGLNNRSGWLVAAVLFGIGGAAFTTLVLLDQVPADFLPGAIISVVMSLVCIYGLRNWTNSRRAIHGRTLLGLALIFGAAFTTEGTLPASLMLTPLLALLGSCCLYGARFAAPYLIIVLTLAGLSIARSPGVQTTAHGVMLLTAMSMIAGSLLVTEHRTRTLARRNARLADSDPLTGIANTRSLRKTLTEMLVDYENDGNEFAVFAIDLDNFKLVNDVFSHATGDLVLKAVARELTAELNPDDLVARRGGDEFSVLATDAGGRDLDQLRDRLEEAIRRARILACPAITPSGSVAYVRAKRGEDLPSILKRADDQLHDVKRAFHEEHGEREALEKVSFSAESLKLITAEAVNQEAPSPRSGNRIARFARVGPGSAPDGDPRWLFAMLTFAPIGVIVGVLSLAGLLEPLSPIVGGIVGAGLIALSVASYVAGERGSSLRLLHPIFVAAVCLLTIAVAGAGEAGGSLIDAYAVLMLFSFYFFSPRIAAMYALACALLFGGFALGVGYADAAERVAMTMCVILVAVGLGIKVRAITVKFARTNRELSEVDALTGLANVRALDSHVQTAVREAVTGRPLPVLISIDLDKFKRVNDAHNHSVGDQTLVAVARAISEVVRDDDIVARRGGDEFVVLGRIDELRAIDELVGRMYQAIVHARLRICPELTATATIGWTAWQPGDDAESFLLRADQALHDERVNSQAPRDHVAVG